MPSTAPIPSPHFDDSWDGELTNLSNRFDDGVELLDKKMKAALKDVIDNPGKASNLAAYQSALSEYNLYRNAQSNVVKVYKDIDAAIIQNFR
ncbi:type III secretion system needle complex protein [Iodobacter ciconiae]|uniref:Type III secretion system needle complex protein n=1 Tax=Iodobacter ciconiae TaxID=2496266 RepID=A0A3S8ZR04_9NEIS|nr:type III secretion system needle complex protein [Iodobacter ciconiae]AZN35913.1 type III secretion system needle complex protein [Iodobacter ciconiae]